MALFSQMLQNFFGLILFSRLTPLLLLGWATWRWYRVTKLGQTHGQDTDQILHATEELRQEYQTSYITPILAKKTFDMPNEYVLKSKTQQWAFHGWLLFRAPLHPSAIFLINQPYTSVRLYLTTAMEYRIFRGTHQGNNEYWVDDVQGTYLPHEVFQLLFQRHQVYLDETLAQTWMTLRHKWVPFQQTPRLKRFLSDD